MASDTLVQPSAPPRTLQHSLRYLLWLELPWLLLLGLPLTFPGRFVPMPWTPTLVLLLFMFWPLHGWLDWRHKSLHHHMAMLPVWGILGALAISVAIAPDRRAAWLMGAHLTWGIALYVALLHWPPSQRWPSLVTLSIIGVALLLSVIGPPLLGKTLRSAWATALFVAVLPAIHGWEEALNPNILAGGLLLALPLLWSWALAPWGRQWSTRIFNILFALVLLALAWWILQVLTLTDSRGAWFAAAISFVVVVVLRWPQLTWPTLMVGFLALFWLLFNDPWERLAEVMANGMARDYNSRMEIWVRSWHAFRTRALTGIGIGNFVPIVVHGMLPIRVTLSPQVTHAHNLLLQVAVDLGVLGLASYLGAMVMSGIGAAQAWRHSTGVRRTQAGGALGALIALNLHGLVDAPLWNSKLAFLPWLLFALCILLKRATHDDLKAERD